jgi:hypothetical protein
VKRQFKKWIFRLVATGLLLLGLLILFMLNPVILYANKAVIGNYSIYHERPLDKNFLVHLEQATVIMKSSELYDSNLTLDICLKDDSKYPVLIRNVLGKDFLSSFSNKIVFTGDTINYKDNYIQLGEHKWNLTQMIAHAGIHCLEFNKYGLWHSNPIGGHPEWKWEGYPEYIARQNSVEKDLRNNIENFLRKDQEGHGGWIMFPDGTEIPIPYYRYMLLIQFCVDIKKMNFVQILKDTVSEGTVKRQMMTWYNGPL